jgi:hypothetical protein
MLRSVIVAALLIGAAFAQGLPDAPQPQPAEVYVVHNSFAAPKSEPRGKKKLLALAGVVGFAIATDVYDVSETEKGLKAGVAVEGNTFLVSSDKPTAGQLYRRDLFVIGLSATPSVVAYAFHKTEFFYAGLVGPVAVGIKHIQGGNQWKSLLAGHAPTGSELGP